MGEIVAGLLLGPSLLGLVQQSEFILQMAEIGVILLMFSAGLGTNLRELMKTGPIALLIATCGVGIPLIGGALLYMCFYGFMPWGSEDFYKAVFMGVILTATSVSITVESLKEMGKLKGKVGTTILSAAIIDDVIGIIVLTFVIGFKNPESNPGTVVMDTVLFFCLPLVLASYAILYLNGWIKDIPIREEFPSWAWLSALPWHILRKNILGLRTSQGPMWQD